MAQLNMSQLSNGEEPSDKQVYLAQRISNCLLIDLPNEFTSYAYWKFINEHIEEWKESRAEYRRQKALTPKSKRYGYNLYDYDSLSEFSVGDGLGIYDCYDFGIHPWGNS